MGKTVLLICIGFLVLDFCWYLFLRYKKKQPFKNYFEYMKDSYKYSKRKEK